MKERRNINRIQFASFLVVILITMVVLALYVGLLYRNNKKEKTDRNYTGHYSFVVDDLSDAFLDAVYDSICEEAGKRGIYVEKVGAGLSGNYSLAEKLEIAIATNPQGIIIEADDSSEIKTLIDQAVDQRIPVSTIITDVSNSKRQSFVGPNYYDLGKGYGEQLRDLSTDEDCLRVALLMNDKMPESNRNSLFQGIIESANQEKQGVDVQIVSIDCTDNLTIEEGIRSAILNSENQYDAIVAANQIMTTYTYQALVDYNKIGELVVLGFYDTESILKGVKNGNLKAIISIDPEEVGKLVTDSIYDYHEYGYSSYYQPVNIVVITKDNVDAFMKKDTTQE